jgi:hypothetical protein
MHLHFSHSLAISCLLFAIVYAMFEYYVIRDSSFGMNPVLFSLVYPYHFVMLVAFSCAAYGLLSKWLHMKGVLAGILLIGCLVSSMLVVEDFAWFTLRALAPLDDDANAGRLITQGEWTTRFAGSTDFYFTHIPNWYFVCILYSAIAFVVVREKEWARPIAVRHP